VRAGRYSPDTLLYSGDALVLVIVTVIGFATHGELATAGLRMLTTYVPLALAWALIAPWLGLYNQTMIHDPRQLWRPVWAWILAAPLAGWLRGFWLDVPIIPIFVLALGGFTALAMLVWRGVYLLLRREEVAHG
jgi:ABC-type xylose transport system permease subunit